MFSSLRKAYASGYRAGCCGTSYFFNPFDPRRKFLRYAAWDNGWHKGMMKRLTGR